jgi:hypothetical protein
MYMNYKNAQAKELVKKNHIPNVNLLLKISLGLVLFTIISSVLVYADSTLVDVDGKSFDLNYSANGVTVDSVSADLDFLSLTLGVQVTEPDAVLELTLDRSFFDSVSENGDQPFMVLVDGDDISFAETLTTDTSRTLRISLPTGTEDVEIFGTVFANPVSESADQVTLTEEPSSQVPEDVNVVQIKQIPAEFVDESKDPKIYVQRYLNEPSYKSWFEENYPDYTFYEALGISESDYDSIVASLSEPVETPIVEETPIVKETPSVECGPGTVLKDSECVLDERCGTGTMMIDGVCEVVESEQPETVKPGMGKELITGIIAAFVIAGIVGIILGIISKGSRSKN